MFGSRCIIALRGGSAYLMPIIFSLEYISRTLDEGRSILRRMPRPLGSRGFVAGRCCAGFVEVGGRTETRSACYLLF